MTVLMKRRLQLSLPVRMVAQSSVSNKTQSSVSSKIHI